MSNKGNYAIALRLESGFRGFAGCILEVDLPVPGRGLEWEYTGVYAQPYAQYQLSEALLS